MIENRKDDVAVVRCGHNFRMLDCPYRYCAARALLEAALKVGLPVETDPVGAVDLRRAIRLAGYSKKRDGGAAA